MGSYKPVFHYCKGGNHFHLVTGLEYGMSPPFISRWAAEFAITHAADPNNGQDVLDAAMLRDQLRLLKMIREKHTRLIFKKRQPWDDASFASWHTMFQPERFRGNVTAIQFFSNLSCDFVAVRRNGDHLTISPIKVKRVRTLEIRG
jgi:hypothetical protein